MIRLIGEDGEQLGVVTSKEGQQIANDRKLDLVKVAPNAKPPVCKLMDYSKYKFEQSKKAKEARKRQKTMDVKEIRLSPNIEAHDINVKAKKAIEFLENGDKVKVSIRFRYGREMGRTDDARNILIDFAKQLSDYGYVDKQPKLEGRIMTLFLAPNADTSV